VSRVRATVVVFGMVMTGSIPFPTALSGTRTVAMISMSGFVSRLLISLGIDMRLAIAAFTGTVAFRLRRGLRLEARELRDGLLPLQTALGHCARPDLEGKILTSEPVGSMLLAVRHRRSCSPRRRPAACSCFCCSTRAPRAREKLPSRVRNFLDLQTLQRPLARANQPRSERGESW